MALIKQPNREPVDGIDMLRRREQTRLWYRMEPEPVEPISPPAPLARAEAEAASTARDIKPAPVGTDWLVRESVSLSANLRKVLENVVEEAEQPATTPGTDALTKWKDAPTHCPVLLLSASQILDARNPGPILGPGTRYRLLSVNDGVAALEVAALDGNVGAGYCNSIDLTCFEPDIATFRRESGAHGRQTARLSLNRISQRISGVTAALVG